jgi:hypothetical protein
MRIGGAGFWSNPKVYPWLIAPFAIVGALWVAARRGKRVREAVRSARAEAPSEAIATRVPAEQRQAAQAASARPAAALPLTQPQGGGSSDADFRKAYLFLIAALDEGLERGEFSRETHTLIRQNLKRRLQALLAEESASGVR